MLSRRDVRFQPQKRPSFPADAIGEEGGGGATWRRTRNAPPCPSRCVATAGGTSPRFDSAMVMGRSRARPPSPSVVAMVKGMANQATPPSR